MKTAILIVLFFTVPGVIMGLVSSYRAGQKPIQDLYLGLKNFAQQKIFTPAVWLHVKLYWMYYGLLSVFVIIAITG